ncbi:response regulator [Flavobacterium sp.]|uniref:response regulator n=1 Tax=Flavobacterium sp. TaxID=239 RepID=UPI0026332A96|nr:response regulator [Flavobacterium sp.]
MYRSGPIVLVEDDADDKEIFEDIVRDLGYENPVIWFENTAEAYEYLSSTPDPVFIICSDINMPFENGLDFKKRIDDNDYLRKKSIPFVFYSTTVTQQAVNEAYTKLTIQGFFKKGDNYNELKELIAVILRYWTYCYHPNMH